jgi:hypothetical protein
VFRRRAGLDESDGWIYVGMTERVSYYWIYVGMTERVRYCELLLEIQLVTSFMKHRQLSEYP